jgi:hypothetical protein
MKTERQFWKRSRHWLMMVGVLVTGMTSMISCSEYDLDERTPDGWGRAFTVGLKSKVARAVRVLISPCD